MCQVLILSVNGIIPPPPGTTAPTQLRVAGTLMACGGGQVTVSSSVTATLTVTANAVTGSFVATMPITATNVQCGSTVSVAAACATDATCTVSQTVTLKCCEITGITLTGLVPPGALTPTHIRIAGSVRGCYGDQIIVGTSISPNSSAIPVDPATGAFSIDLSINNVASCDDTVDYNIVCAQNAGCSTKGKLKLICPDCARAQVSYAGGPCSGTPQTQLVTLNATINIAAGTQRFLRWVYGDGAQGTVFSVNNAAGTANTPYQHSETHNYSPGTYTARLIVTNSNGSPLECTPILLAVQATCGPCPTVVVTADPPGPCVNGTRSVTFHASISGVPASGVALQWSFPGSLAPGTTAFVVNTNGPLPNQAVSYPAGSVNANYSGTLTIVLPSGCPSGSTTVTISPCPSCCPTLSLAQPVVTGCAPSTAQIAFTATLNWPSGCTPQSPTSYAWTLSAPGGQTYQLSTTQATASTNVPWVDSSTGTPGTVQLSAGGSYSVAVTATLAPGTIAASCPPATATLPFTVPPCCPQLIGPLNASPSPTDPCTWLFSAQVSNPSGAQVSFVWTFQDGTTAQTTVPQVTHTYLPGAVTTGTTTLTLKSPGCPDVPLSVIVTQHCGSSGTTTTTTTTTTSTTTTTTSSSGGGMGCICTLLLVIALGALVFGAVTFVIWGCTGMLSAGLFSTALTASIAGLAILGLWIALCRACPVIRFLASFLQTVAVILFAIAAVLVLFGQIGCAAGTLLAGGVFASAAAALRAGAKLLMCP